MEKIVFPPKPDGHLDRHTYRRTDISVYRVASLLKRIRDYYSEYNFSNIIEILKINIWSDKKSITRNYFTYVFDQKNDNFEDLLLI